MNTRPYTRDEMQVNSGVVRPSEVPLWAGLSNVTIDGQRIRMSVTSDKGWFWLRFRTKDGMLAPEQHADMEARGWQFSKKKRLGYWHSNPTNEQVKFVRALGYSQAALPNPVVEVVATASGNALPLPGVKATSGNGRVMNGPLTNAVTTSRLPVVTAQVDVPTSSGLRYNKAGRLIDENGRFIKAADVAAQVEAVQATPLPVVVEEVDEPAPWEEVTVEATSQPAAVADDDGDYDLGYEDGVADATDPEYPGVYDRKAMAELAGMTLMKLTATLGNSYIQGYLHGFETQRPKPQPVRGLAARLAERTRK